MKGHVGHPIIIQLEVVFFSFLEFSECLDVSLITLVVVVLLGLVYEGFTVNCKGLILKVFSVYSPLSH